jgi:signal transduction histidine kinase
MTTSRPVWWVSTLLYAAVLLAGGFAQLTGLGHGRPVPFLAALTALFVLEAGERRRWPTDTPAVAAAILLAVRLALYVVATATDGAGLSRALFALVPFIAYFAFGRTASIVLAVACVGLVVVGDQLSTPRWYADVGHVSDLLMLCLGLALTVVTASVAVQERTGRVRLETYAAQVAELSAADERNRLARDIHDDLGHRLTAVAVLLEKAAAFEQRDPPLARRALHDAQECARQALEDVRRSVRTLRVADPFRLSAALDQLVRAAGAGRPAVEVTVSGDENRYDQPTLTTLYRAAQEGITNARRHSGANRVQVNVDLDPHRASLVVADDGCGFPLGREGFGLLGMRERVQLVHGRVDIATEPGAGTQLAVTIPRTP